MVVTPRWPAPRSQCVIGVPRSLVDKPSPGARPIAPLLQLLRGLERDLQRADERAYKLRLALAEIDRAIGADAAGRLTPVVKDALRRAASGQRERAHAASLRVQAEGGMRRLDVRVRATGDASVRADDGKWFDLPRVLANLLLVLASAVGTGTDGFPMWLPMEKVVEQIGRKAGTKPSRRSLTQAIYRLRGVLSANGLNPYLIQVDRKRGLRLLVRRESADGQPGKA